MPRDRRPFRHPGPSAELNRTPGHAVPEPVDDGALGDQFVGCRAEGDELLLQEPSIMIQICTTSVGWAHGSGERTRRGWVRGCGEGSGWGWGGGLGEMAGRGRDAGLAELPGRR